MSGVLTSRSGIRDVQVHRDITEIDQAVWDSIVAPNDLQMSHRFVRTCQEANVEQAEYRHVVITDSAGVACVATLSFFPVKLDLLTSRRLRRATGVVRTAWNGFLKVPVLFCGLPVSFGQPCLAWRPDAPPDSWLPALCDVVDETAAALGADLCCFKEFDADKTVALRPLERRGYFAAASLPSCGLRLRWPTFEAYVADMRSAYRRQALHARRDATGAGLRFRVVRNPTAFNDRFFGLYEQVMDRVEFQLERLNLGFFERLTANFPEETAVVLAETDDRVAAAALVLTASGVSTFLLAGIDYEANRQTQAYVALVAEVVATAISCGARYLELGQTSYDIKRRLGARTTPRTIFLRHRSPMIHRLLAAARSALFPAREYAPRHVFRVNGAPLEAEPPDRRGADGACPSRGLPHVGGWLAR